LGEVKTHFSCFIAFGELFMSPLTSVRHACSCGISWETCLCLSEANLTFRKCCRSQTTKVAQMRCVLLYWCILSH